MKQLPQIHYFKERSVPSFINKWTYMIRTEDKYAVEYISAMKSFTTKAEAEVAAEIELTTIHRREDI